MLALYRRYGVGGGRLADVKIGGEDAKAVPVQTIGEIAYTMPASCTGKAITDFQSLMANGILGVGIYLQDCGSACAETATSVRNPGLYYTCTSTRPSACAIASASLAEQIPNPVASFATDNNGIVIRLPSVPPSGDKVVQGSLVFGIGTRANNALGGATPIALDSTGAIRTAFPAGGTEYRAVLDSGSNAIFFLNSAITNIPLCTTSPDFYCPSTTLNLSATVSGAIGASVPVAFSVADASQLGMQYFAFDNLAGPLPGFSTDAAVPGFDWGLPFFFGRDVYTAIEGQSTPGGTGPYFAF